MKPQRHLLRRNWSSVKEEILNSRSWVIHLDEGDIDAFEDGGIECISVFEAITEDTSENRFKYLGEQISESFPPTLIGNYSKLLMYIQYPASSPIMMSELDFIQRMMNILLAEKDDCEIKWGLLPREGSVFRVVCSINTGG